MKQSVTNSSPANAAIRETTQHPASTNGVRGENTYLLPWGHPAGWPAIPSGTHGRFRSTEACLLDAASDREAIAAWLDKKGRRSHATLQAYQREVTRLLLWAAQTRGAALSDLSSRDYLAYKQFLADPQPREQWVAGGGKKRSVHDPGWRPFHGCLSGSSQQYALRVIRDLLSFLVQAHYLSGNPLAMISLDIDQEQPRSAQETSARSARRRALSAQAWESIKAHINALSEDSTYARFRKARARWTFMLLYTLGPRISDLTGTFGDMHRETIGENELWIWSLRGKGRKFAELPLAHALVEEMMRFRQHVGIPALPYPGESTPLVPRASETNRNRPLSRQGLHRMIEEILQGAAIDAASAGSNSVRSELEDASAHSLRHTAARDTLEHSNDMRVTAELLRHADIRTTQMYTAPQLERLMEALEGRPLTW